MRTTHGIFLLVLLTATANGADVYRSTAPDGTVSYSDRPQSANSEFVFSANHTRPAAPSTPPAEGAAPPQAPATPTLPEGPTAAELREQRKKNCDVARETQERYTLSRRLYRTNAAGEREYLNDQEIAQARAKAADDVKDWCS